DSLTTGFTTNAVPQGRNRPNGRKQMPIARMVKMLVAASIAALFFGAAAHAADKATLLLNWYAYGEHAPFFLGKEKGFYSKHGIDLDIQEGRGSAVTIQAVAAGTVNFAYADVPTMIRAA